MWSFIPGREGVEVRPYGVRLRWSTDNVIAPHPPCTNPSVTALSAATAPLSGEPRGGWGLGAFARLFTTMLIPSSSLTPVRGGVPDAPRLWDCRGWVGCRRSAWPIAPASPPRCVRWRPPPNVFDFAEGAGPRTFGATRRPTSSFDRRKGRRGRRPLRRGARHTAAACMVTGVRRYPCPSDAGRAWKISPYDASGGGRRPSTARMAVRPSFLCSPSRAW